MSAWPHATSHPSLLLCGCASGSLDPYTPFTPFPANQVSVSCDWRGAVGPCSAKQHAKLQPFSERVCANAQRSHARTHCPYCAYLSLPPHTLLCSQTSTRAISRACQHRAHGYFAVTCPPALCSVCNPPCAEVLPDSGHARIPAHALHGILWLSCACTRPSRNITCMALPERGHTPIVAMVCNITCVALPERGHAPIVAMVCLQTVAM